MHSAINAWMGSGGLRDDSDLMLQGCQDLVLDQAGPLDDRRGLEAYVGRRGRPQGTSCVYAVCREGSMARHDESDLVTI